MQIIPKKEVYHLEVSYVDIDHATYWNGKLEEYLLELRKNIGEEYCQLNIQKWL